MSVRQQVVTIYATLGWADERASALAGPSDLAKQDIEARKALHTASMKRKLAPWWSMPSS